MNKFRNIIRIVAWLLAALPVGSCVYPLEHDQAELMVSLYIPDILPTKAQTGPVSALDFEKRIFTLQVWAFLSEDGSFVSYRSFDNRLSETGLPNTTITRFGMPLSPEMFEVLTGGAAVDVYAVANAAAATDVALDENTPRSVLAGLALSGDYFGVSPLTTAQTQAIEERGIPMTGVIKGATVTGGYPVLYITSLTLTRVVSKIRFVFCQQEVPASETQPARPVNSACEILSISFDGTDNGKDCQIGASEKLFTTQKHPVSNTLFDIGDEDPPLYAPLKATISGTPLIANDDLARAEDPEVFGFRSSGYENETAQQYENRLDGLLLQDPAKPNSQIGPIYLRETDKPISGTITYRVSENGSPETVSFSMGSDVLSRNHSWILYAFFAQETKTLQLRIVVQPWEWTSYAVDHTTGAVNVIRRFTMLETNPPTFKRSQSGDFIDIQFWHTISVIDEENSTVGHVVYKNVDNELKGDIIIATPIGATLHAVAVAGAEGNKPVLTDAISVLAVTPVDQAHPSSSIIYPNWVDPATENENGKIEDCKLEFIIKPNKTAYTDEQLKGQFIDLHLYVEKTEGGVSKYIDLGSESRDYYRFILTEQWNQE